MNWFLIKQFRPIFFLSFLFLSTMVWGQNDVLTKYNVPVKVSEYTLLVIKYEFHDPIDVTFGKTNMSKKEIEKFLEKKNKHIVHLNKKLTKIFRSYHYNYRIISSNDISSYDPEKYRFVLHRFLVKRESLRKVKMKTYFTYSHYFRDRVKKKKL